MTAADTPICLYSKTWRSGVGLFTHELARGMVEAGADVLLVSPAADIGPFEMPSVGLRRTVTRRERLSGSRHARIAASLARIASGLWGLLAARATARLFVVNVPDPLVFSLPVFAALRLTGARIAYIVHDPLPHKWRLPDRLRWVENLGYRAIYALSDRLVVLSETSRAALIEAYRIDPAKVVVIEHGVFVTGAPVPPPGEGSLLVFGSLRRNKGVREAIEGVVAARAAGLPVRLTIAGIPHGADASYWAECEVVAGAHPDVVELAIGYVDEADIGAMIARSDAFLMPYRAFFSQSGVATLAASNARPVIATRAGGLGDLADDGLPLVEIAAPPTAEGVADAIGRFVAVPAADWWERGRAYRAHMLERRSWTVIGRDYLRLAQALGA